MPYLPKPSGKGGSPRQHAWRDILDAIFYLLKTGCQWRSLPGDFPPSKPLALTFINGNATVFGKN